MVEFCRDRNANSAKSMARSVRSFLRFAHASGRTTSGLWGAVPRSAGWRLASLPRAVPVVDVERMLAVAAHVRCTATGRRNYAILLLLVRLGLRRGEVAGLRLDDIDWRAGELTVVGKGERVERLPLPTEPGEAIAAWLTDGRPAVPDTVGVHHAQPARSAGVAGGCRPCRGHRMPERRTGPDRSASSASHAGHGHAAGGRVTAGGGAGAAPPQREVDRDLRQGR
jgi:integrase